MREPLHPDVRDNYERPNQTWICGLAEEGPPCPLGPTIRGFCSQGVACHPLRDGDRWVCNRSPLRGGPCPEGPTPEGECCRHYSCSPVRSLRAKRGRFVWAMSLATLGALCLTFSSDWRNELLAPGPLSAHHAQLVARGDDRSQRCGSCHAAGNQSFVEWVFHATDSTLAAPTQSDLCLNCHDKEIPRDVALFAHSVKNEVLLASQGEQASGRRVDPRGEFACSTCHREHQGTSFDLTAMSDSSCQACHRQQYHSFATDHPDFQGWPTRRRTRIAFDHAAHQAKHFPAEKQQFACGQCHQQTSSGFQETLGYAASCAKCHDSDIQTSWQLGLNFASLPMIDTEALTEAGHEISPWPEAASGDFDGSLPLLTKFLLLSNKDVVQAIDQLGPDFDFFDVDLTNGKQLAAAAIILREFKKLLSELAEQGHGAIGSRMKAILGRELTTSELAALVAHLSAENMSSVGAWTTDTPPQATVETSSPPASGGGWARDDETFALRYLAAGHDDPWLASWMTLISEATHGPEGRVAENILLQMMKPTAPGMCGNCHSVDRDSNGDLTINWHAKRESTKPEFTVFSHTPHVLQTELADCATCHRFEESASVMATYTQQNPREFTSGFHAVTKQDCAVCHKPGAAGDTCTQCHRYHVAHPTKTP